MSAPVWTEFASGAAANPTLTLAALGFRLADHLTEQRR